MQVHHYVNIRSRSSTNGTITFLRTSWATNWKEYVIIITTLDEKQPRRLARCEQSAWYTICEIIFLRRILIEQKSNNCRAILRQLTTFSSTHFRSIIIRHYRRNHHWLLQLYKRLVVFVVLLPIKYMCTYACAVQFPCPSGKGSLKDENTCWPSTTYVHANQTKGQIRQHMQLAT